MNPHSEEVAYLKRLIRDFPADVKPEDAQNALNKIAARYQVIEQSYQALSITNFEKSSLDIDRVSTFKLRVSMIHEYLFRDILKNAGEFRKVSDPNAGSIGFGGLKHQGQQSKFKGTPPSKIEDELHKALSNLDYEAENPIGNALRFYQHFVWIHPFYDANGRIGRVIVSVYLYYFDLYVQWGEFDGPNNGKFINKLNECHKRMESGYRFEKYFGYLLDFFRQFVIPIDELSDFE